MRKNFKGLYDEAIEDFTAALLLDDELVEAMENRASIHFRQKEYSDCVIECEEILKIKQSERFVKLKSDAEAKIIDDEPWHQVLGVPRSADKAVVEKAFHYLAKKYHLNSKQRSSISHIDQKKMTFKMANVNRAMEQYRALPWN